MHLVEIPMVSKKMFGRNMRIAPRIGAKLKA